MRCSLLFAAKAIRSACANAAALRSEKSVGWTIERMAFIAASHIRFDEHLHSSKWSIRSIAPGSIRRAALHSHWIEERSGDMFNANIPALSQNFLRLIDMRAAVVRLTVLSAMLLAVSSPATFAQSAGGGSPVGMRQFEYIDPHAGGRHLALAVFYPAIRDAAPPFVMPFFTKLNLYKDAEPAFNGTKRPLVMFSHGRGSNGVTIRWCRNICAMSCRSMPRRRSTCTTNA